MTHDKAAQVNKELERDIAYFKKEHPGEELPPELQF
jgi:hypothetical protein